MPEPFDVMQYTADSLAKELYLMELHSKDGSAVDADCACIQEKHLLGIEGLALEGANIATKEKERKFYADLAQQARRLRKTILYGEFDFKGSNPGPRTNKLASCIKKLEIQCCGGPTQDYSKCTCNPVAVCRASVKA
ncbi:hypothetical protein KAR91_45830 [Candidatus Pacearchaeota archaeon]|nr:hypothetical protein [Candidatus Pacearchaeota archaeon]